MNRKLSLIVTLIVVIALLINPTNVKAFPSLPSSFYGKIKVNNVDVADGTLVEALINGQVIVKTKTITNNGESYYTIIIPSDDAATSALEGGKEGDILTFNIRDLKSTQTGIWHSGTNVELNLNSASTTTTQSTQSTDSNKSSSSTSGIPFITIPSLPSGFYGKVKINNINVPDGTLIEILVNGQVIANTKTLTFDGNSYYKINIPGDDISTSVLEGGKEGDVLSITVDGLKSIQTTTWHSGTNILLDLSIKSSTPSSKESSTPIIPVTNSRNANQPISLNFIILAAVMLLIIIVVIYLLKIIKRKRNAK